MSLLLGAQADEVGDEVGQSDNLTAVMESMGIYDTDLRAHGNTSEVSETQRLLKILLATLNKAVAHSSAAVQSNHGEPSTGSGRVDPVVPDPDRKKQNEPPSQTNYTEVRYKQLVLGSPVTITMVVGRYIVSEIIAINDILVFFYTVLRYLIIYDSNIIA